MARFYGPVGYGESVESTPGVWKDAITEITYQGDVIRNVRQTEQAVDKLNLDVVISNSISIVADQFAIENFMNIRYVGWAGVLWSVPSVEVRSPRLILTLGSVYNGPVPIHASVQEPSFDSETGELSVVDQEGVFYKNIDMNEILNEEGSPYLVSSGDSMHVVARPLAGYFFGTDESHEWTFTAD